jgi:para-nitrobenzyl esterase
VITEAERGQPIEATVDQGTLRGFVSRDVQIFRAVPYAAPPTGVRRFAPPQAAEAWPGVRDAMDFAAPSAQASFEVVDGKPTMSAGKAIGSEDCLYLNIYAPATDGCHPVLVWIHGGGAIMGSPKDIDGTSLARAGIVVVTVAYRLGALGLLQLRGVFDETAEANFATLDQIAALGWVKKNIAAFGGDPTRVTVGGQSNGARCISTLLCADSASGLFEQALMMSGTGGGHLIYDESEAQLVTESLLRELNVPARDAGRLRELPAGEIVAAQTRLVKRWPTLLPFQAVVDRVVVPERPIDAIRRGAAKDVKLLIGTTHDEFDLFAPDSGGGGSYRSMVVTPETLATATDAYRHRVPAAWTDADVARHALTSSDWWIPAIRLAEAHSSAGGTAWMYRLDWRLSPRGQGLGAAHGLDTAVMGRPDAPPTNYTPSAEDAPRFASVVSAMRRAFTGFVSDADLSSWLWFPYEQSRRSTYLFDDLSHTELDPDRDLRLVWQDLL